MLSIKVPSSNIRSKLVFGGNSMRLLSSGLSPRDFEAAINFPATINTEALALNFETLFAIRISSERRSPLSVITKDIDLFLLLFGQIICVATL